MGTMKTIKDIYKIGVGSSSIHTHHGIAKKLRLYSMDYSSNTMKETGMDLPSLYKETSQGGFARDFTQMDYGKAIWKVQFM